MIRELKSPNCEHHEARNMGRSARWLMRPRADLVVGELAAVGSTPLELFCVAILIAGETPGVFGTSTGVQSDLDSHFATAVAKRDELFRLISEGWSAADCDPPIRRRTNERRSVQRNQRAYSSSRYSRRSFDRVPEVRPTAGGGLAKPKNKVVLLLVCVHALHRRSSYSPCCRRIFSEE
jgi:hypothetical protein